MDEEARVEAAVRAYFSAGDERTEHAAGELRDELLLWDEIEDAWRDRGTVVDLRRVAVTDIGAERATAEIEATSVREAEHARFGVSRAVADFSGPVELVRENAEWRVADHHIDGRSRRADTIVLDGEEIRAGPVTVTPRLVNLRRNTIVVVAELRNDAEHPVEVRELGGLAMRPASPSDYIALWSGGRRVIDPGATVVTYFSAGVPLPLSWRGRVLLELREEGRTHRLEVLLDLPAKTARLRGRRRPVSYTVWRLWHARRELRILAIGLVGIAFAAFGWWSALTAYLVVLAVGALAIAILWGIRFGRRTARPMLAMAAVFGVLAASLTGGGPIASLIAHCGGSSQRATDRFVRLLVLEGAAAARGIAHEDLASPLPAIRGRSAEAVVRSGIADPESCAQFLEGDNVHCVSYEIGEARRLDVYVFCDGADWRVWDAIAYPD